MKRARRLPSMTVVSAPVCSLTRASVGLLEVPSAVLAAFVYPCLEQLEHAALATTNRHTNRVVQLPAASVRALRIPASVAGAAVWPPALARMRPREVHMTAPRQVPSDLEALRRLATLRPRCATLCMLSGVPEQCPLLPGLEGLHLPAFPIDDDEMLRVAKACGATLRSLNARWMPTEAFPPAEFVCLERVASPLMSSSNLCGWLRLSTLTSLHASAGHGDVLARRIMVFPPALTDLALRRYVLFMDDVRMLVQQLTRSSTPVRALRHLSLADNPCADYGALSALSVLESLDLRLCAWADGGALVLPQSMPALRLLQLTPARVGYTDVPAYPTLVELGHGADTEHLECLRATYARLPALRWVAMRFRETPCCSTLSALIAAVGGSLRTVEVGPYDDQTNECAWNAAYWLATSVFDAAYLKRRLREARDTPFSREMEREWCADRANRVACDQHVSEIRLQLAADVQRGS